MTDPTGVTADDLAQGATSLRTDLCGRLRVVDVDRITGRWEVREGQYKHHHFSVVTTEEDFFELVYDTRTMAWLLTRTDLEGS